MKHALICKDEAISFLELKSLVELKANDICRSKEVSKISFLEATPNVAFVSGVLAHLKCERPVAIISSHWNSWEKKECIEGLTQSARDLNPETVIIMFTSGTSGQLLPVQLSKKNIEAGTKAVSDSLGLAEEREQILFLPLHYSFGLLSQLLPALASGVSTTLLGNFWEIKEYLQGDSLKGMLSGVPSHWERILRLGETKKFESVTRVVSAGDFLSLGTRKKLKDSFPNARLFNCYGLTEASPRVLTLSSECEKEFFREGTTGYPVGDWETKISKMGELCLKGGQVMLGYLGKEKETKTKIQNGWLLTGDVATREQDGLISVQGRRDDIVKIGGERTSLPEIESALKLIPGVNDAAVIVQGQPEDARVTAFLEIAPNYSGKRRDYFARSAADHLAPHKIPREFFIVDEIPRTESGKIIRSKILTLGYRVSL